MAELPEDWQPLDVREGRDDPRFTGAHRGVPVGLFESLWVWIKNRIYIPQGRNRFGHTQYALLRQLIQEAERRVGFRVADENATSSTVFTRLREQFAKDRNLMLRVVDFLAAKYAPDSRPLEDLDKMLHQAGSIYRVAFEPYPHLQQRVNATAQQVAEAAMARADTAAQLLADAWTQTFGVEPNPRDGYRQAVRAVEAAAIPVVLPNDQEAHLGRLIGHLKSTRDRWAVVLPGREDKVDPVDALIGMLELLWTSQYDRHVREGAPLHIEQPEAEAAMPLAACLVDWFQTGAIQTKG